jgi:hypothetical protein
MAKKTATKKSVKKTAKKSVGRRELLRTGTDARYAKRDAGGHWTEMDDVGKSQRADKARKAKTVVSSGYGDQGDQKTPAKRAAKKR